MNHYDFFLSKNDQKTRSQIFLDFFVGSLGGFLILKLANWVSRRFSQVQN